MDPALAPYAARARERMSEEEFVARVERARAEFDGLLDDEALALLVLDEAGLNEGAFVELSEIAERGEASVRVTVERIEPPREFAREGRPPGRVCNVVVSDATAEARVVLWDKDVEKAEDGTLHAGARVTLVGARVKLSRFGPELHVTPWTAVEVEGAPDAARRKLLLDVKDGSAALALALGREEGVPDAALRPRAVEAPGPLRATFLAVSPTRPFRRADGTVGFACDAELDTAEGRLKVVCWDEAVKAVRALLPGCDVVVEGLVAKARSNGVEWHTTPATIIRPAPERQAD